MHRTQEGNSFCTYHGSLNNKQIDRMGINQLGQIPEPLSPSFTGWNGIECYQELFIITCFEVLLPYTLFW